MGIGGYKYTFFFIFRIVFSKNFSYVAKKWLLCLYYHFPIVLLGFYYDAYMMRI